MDTRNPSSNKTLAPIALIGNYPPRKCGIATFSADLLMSFRNNDAFGECYSVAMNDTAEGYNYPPEVHYEINEERASEYRLTARILNMHHIGAVSLQHEYGIYGGESGCLIVDLLEHLQMPVLTTLHTVLKNPSPSHHSVMKRISELSESLVVLSDISREILLEEYEVPESRIIHIPHGIPDLAFVDPAYFKEQFEVEGRRVILTFGLLAPNKGIEYMIEAMPQIVKEFPDVIYIILGTTHPHVLQDNDEAYRSMLQQRVKQLGIQEHVLFHNKFVSLQVLTEFLGCADVYVTPYLTEAQAVSGTLAYALGAGKAVVSTPYWYAEEMLSDGRGILVPFRDSDALGSAITSLFHNPVKTTAMRKQAYDYCRDMTWPRVSEQYALAFTRVTEHRLRRHHSTLIPTGRRELSADLPALKLDHLRQMTDSTGIIQHAKFSIPNRNHGYSTDDNARALMVAVMCGQFVSLGVDTQSLVTTYLSFMHHAYNKSNKRFNNFMTYQRAWIDEIGSEDCHGRSMMALGTVIRFAKDEGHLGVALELFNRGLRAVEDLVACRSWATTLIGIHAFRQRFPGTRITRRIGDRLSKKLMNLFASNMNDDWKWLDDKLTYDNAVIPHALLVTGADTEKKEMIDMGLEVLEWLFQIQNENGVFTPVGNRGWFPRGEIAARYDQQPLEASGMVAACMEAYSLTGLEDWENRAMIALDWFLGRNDAHAPVYDYTTGGSYDGLQSNGLNRNEGAESTVAWLLALLTVMRHQAKAFSPTQKKTTPDSETH